MKTTMLLLGLMLVLGFAVRQMADADPFGSEDLEVGAKAPGFRLNDQAGKAFDLRKAGKGRWVVLAFYPKSRTPG